ncbi:MAG: ECF transporter S component [Clostridia bacterium]|nr:ECF transporter S component [Clostridia bacterium]
MQNKQIKLTKQNIAAIIIIVFLIPLTLYASYKFSDRKYYLTSVLIIIYSMLPFFFVFEKRKPQARELVVLAVLCAIAVASRAAFIWLPHFKPMMAIIIIIGASLGAEAGFLTGAVSSFVSNFIFGQGPWTPWQMFSFGVVGFLAGLLFASGIISKARLPLCIFGGLSVLLIAGPILDTCTLFTMMSMLTKENMVAIYISGLPVNAVHALATVLTLLLFSQPMFEKLDRIKTKYGVLEA